MSEKLGVQVIKNAVGFGIQLSMTLSADLADKKITLQEAFSLLPLVMQFPEIVNKLPQLKAEWADRDPAELAELSSYFKNKFDLPNEKSEAIIEGAIDVVITVLNEISLIQAAGK